MPQSARAAPRLKFKPKYDKIVELLLYLSRKRPGADQYQAVKFFYLADREHLNRYGRPITFEAYYALPYGPVATHALDMIRGDKAVLKKAGLNKLPIHMQQEGKRILLLSPRREINFDVFSKSDLKVFDDILRRYGSKTFVELYGITHSHFAYRNAWNHRDKDKDAAPMQYEDMIMSRPIRKAGLEKEDVIKELEAIAEHM